MAESKFTKDNLMPRPYPDDKSKLRESKEKGKLQWWCYDKHDEILDYWWHPQDDTFPQVDEDVKWYIGCPLKGSCRQERNKAYKPEKADNYPMAQGEYWTWCPDLGGAVVLNWPKSETLWDLYAKYYVPVPLDDLDNV